MKYSAAVALAILTAGCAGVWAARPASVASGTVKLEALSTVRGHARLQPAQKGAAFRRVPARVSSPLNVELVDDPVRAPGVIIDHVPAATRQYVGSPSLVVLPNGVYIASHDVFGPGGTSDHTVLFASSNQGTKWEKRAEISGQFWSGLFVHGGALYLMGTTGEYGNVVIRRSRDEGRTWTDPMDGYTGLLLKGAKYHTAPVPVVVSHGRIWRAMEDAMGPDGWGRHFRSFMMSAPTGADLLKADNWTCTNRLARDASWLGGRFGGWLEGNAVAAPDGNVVNVLRVDDLQYPEHAAIVRISGDGKTAAFDPTTGFIPFPGGSKKFTIRYDPVSRRYWSLVNDVPPALRSHAPGATRNTVALSSSSDLFHWETRATLLRHPDTEKHAFQYLDWQFDGNDIIAVSRTAYDDAAGGAHTYHDANYLTFHRIAGFRTRKLTAGEHETAR